MGARRASDGGLRISAGLTLPVEAVTETFAIIANRGAGKSSAARVMAEEFTPMTPSAPGRCWGH